MSDTCDCLNVSKKPKLRTSKTCYMKEARHERSDSTRFHLCEVCRIDKSIEREHSLAVARDGEGGVERNCFLDEGFYLE